MPPNALASLTKRQSSMRSLAVLVFMLLTKVCHAQFSVEFPKIADTSWVHEGSDAPRMCIRFLPDGKVKFIGGFVFYQPSYWKGDLTRVSIILGGKVPFPTETAAYQKQHRPKSLNSFDPEKRTLVYEMLGHYDSFDFLGFVFFRADHCVNP